MKKLISLLAMVLIMATSFGQFNHPEEALDEYSCSHQKQYLENSYYSPVVQKPLLDKYDVKFYFLDIIVQNDTVYQDGNTTILAEVTAAVLDTFACELIPEINVDSAFINGVLHTVIHQDDEVLIPLGTPLNSGDMISVQIYYHGTPPTGGGFFGGVSIGYSSDYEKSVVYSLSEPYAAKEWFPVKQDLQDKADSCWVFLTTSDKNMAGSQGLLTAVTPMPDNMLRYEWKSNYPIDYYLISFAVSEYQEYNIYAHPEGLNDSILIQNYIYDHPDCLPDNQAGIDNTAGLIELFSELFSMYPFPDEKYGHCLTTLGGGMEHQTMTTIGNFGSGLVAHELGHMWWGDNITCATWMDIWINEGFATYSDYLHEEYLHGTVAAQHWLTARHNHVKLALDGSVYVPEDDIWNVGRIFSGRLSYSKGALLLHMIRFELQDDDIFFQILHNYTNQYADSVATGLDFKKVLEGVSGMDFTDFFDQWYFGEGYPIYDITWSYYDDSLHINSTQTTSAAITPLFKMLVPYLVEFDDESDTTLLLYQEENLDSYTIALEKPVTGMLVDPEQWILHELNSLTFGVEEESSPVYFSFGPNPTSGKIRLFVPGNHGKLSLFITDLAGRRVVEETFEGDEWRGDVSGLHNGVYLMNVTDGERTLSKKFIKR